MTELWETTSESFSTLVISPLTTYLKPLDQGDKGLVEDEKHSSEEYRQQRVGDKVFGDLARIPDVGDCGVLPIQELAEQANAGRTGCTEHKNMLIRHAF